MTRLNLILLLALTACALGLVTSQDAAWSTPCSISSRTTSGRGTCRFT